MGFDRPPLIGCGLGWVGLGYGPAPGVEVYYVTS